MVNRSSRIGLSFEASDCAPSGVEHDVSIIFDAPNVTDDEIRISIVETKRGGRTYRTQAVIEKSDMQAIMERLL